MGIGYRDVAADLRRSIRDGTYGPGAVLPKQEDIAASFGVNIKTVRQAIRLLEAEGLVTPVRRRGTVVRTRPPMKRLGVERYAKSKWKYGEVRPGCVRCRPRIIRAFMEAGRSSQQGS